MITNAPLHAKDAECIREGLAKVLLRAEHVWGMSPVKRVHSDREGAILANRGWLHSNAIVLTTTEGHQSQANSVAEGVIATLSSGTRAALEQCTREIAVDARKAVRQYLWAEAFTFAAVLRSAFAAEQAAQNPGAKDEARILHLQNTKL